jgi:hypothetical protein
VRWLPASLATVFCRLFSRSKRPLSTHLHTGRCEDRFSYLPCTLQDAAQSILLAPTYLLLSVTQLSFLKDTSSAWLLFYSVLVFLPRCPLLMATPRSLRSLFQAIALLAVFFLLVAGFGFFHYGDNLSRIKPIVTGILHSSPAGVWPLLSDLLSTF